MNVQCREDRAELWIPCTETPSQEGASGSGLRFRFSHLSDPRKVPTRCRGVGTLRSLATRGEELGDSQGRQVPRRAEAQGKVSLKVFTGEQEQ